MDKNRYIRHLEIEIDSFRRCMEGAENPDIRVILEAQHDTLVRMRNLVLYGCFDLEMGCK